MSARARPFNCLCHFCASVIVELRKTIESVTTGNNRSNALKDVEIALRHLSSLAPLDSSPLTRCLFCSITPKIIDIADSIQPKLDRIRTLEGRVHQLEGVREEMMADLSDDFRMLNEELQSILDVFQTNPAMNPPSLSAEMLNNARNIRINGGNFNNFAGTSNASIPIRQDSGIGVPAVLVSGLLLLAVLFFRLG